MFILKKCESLKYERVVTGKNSKFVTIVSLYIISMIILSAMQL